MGYFRDCGKESEKIHVNLYDDEITETEFDRFAELGTYSKIKKQYRLDKGKAKENADSIIDLLRSRLTFSKFRVADKEEQAYAHLTLFRNNQKVERVSIDINNHISGIACDGLLNGEASCSENQNYYTGFGLRNVESNRSRVGVSIQAAAGVAFSWVGKRDGGGSPANFACIASIKY